jgi:hypothetical protein
MVFPIKLRYFPHKKIDVPMCCFATMVLTYENLSTCLDIFLHVRCCICFLPIRAMTHELVESGDEIYIDSTAYF